MIKYINNKILQMSQDITYTIKDIAPSTERELFNSSSLIVWSGGSSNTIYQDPKVNYAFRAVHDNVHLITGLGFSPVHEIEMGRIQAAALASRCESLLADLFYCEIAEQAKYYLETNTFVENQISFTNSKLMLKF